ncbi:MAG TPA: flagellar hook-length control protein FliK [Steroidobacteraceae bacterium]|nr:flagellar hook-length control protein FliK [Steroidobacteraceae bacterium]
MSPNSMPAPAASTPASPASADLAVLRAAPARPAATAAQGADARDPAPPGKESPAGGAEKGTAGPNARAAVATPAGDATPTNTASTFGQTLAASMTASAAPAQPAAATPARSLKGKSADTKPADAQTAASANRANQALIAAGLIPQSFSPGAADAGAGSAGDGQAQAPAIAAAIAPAIAPTIAPTIAPGAAASPSVAQPPVNMTVTGALKASEPDALELPRGTAAPGPDEDAPAAAAISSPTRATLQSALSAAIRIQGGPESGTSSNQTAGNGNDLAGIGAALSGAAASTGAAAQAPPAAAPQSAANVTVQVHTEVGSSSWATELGTRLHWMTGAGIGSASLRLTPAELGPVEVKISVHQNAASVWFSAAQPDTRTALEQALPRLKELFSAQGMNLAQAGVSDQSARSAPREREPHASGARAGAGRELTATSIPSTTRAHQGLIDTYA